MKIYLVQKDQIASKASYDCNDAFVVIAASPTKATAFGFTKQQYLEAEEA